MPDTMYLSPRTCYHTLDWLPFGRREGIRQGGGDPRSYRGETPEHGTESQVLGFGESPVLIGWHRRPWSDLSATTTNFWRFKYYGVCFISVVLTLT